MKALILAAGYATRLWPLTLNTPKPLICIGKRPIINYIIEKIKAVRNIEKVYVVTNSNFMEYFRDWQRTSKGSERIDIIDNKIKDLHKRRGSVGDIIFSIDKRRINSDLLVVAGDNLFNSGITDFIKQAKKNSPSATIGLFDIKNCHQAKKYGIVLLDDSNKIISFEEKPKNPKSTLAAMCLYYFPKEKLAMLKKYKAEGNCLDMAGNFVKWLSRRESVYGYIFKGKWLDIGDMESLKKAQRVKWQS